MKSSRPLSHATRSAFLAACSLCCSAGWTSGADVDRSKLPPPARVEVDFNRDIKPIFEAACFRCHGPVKPKGRFRLDNQESALKGGELNKSDIVPGDSTNSPLIHYVAGLVEDLEMPPKGKGDALTADQIGLLRRWIDEGAKWPPELATAVRETSFTITPTVRWISVEGDKRKFREDWGQKEGFSAGYEHFELRQPVGEDSELVTEGRALFDQHDYRVALSLAKPDVGFVRGGYESYRKYFDDSGGYYAPFNQPPSSLDRDLHLDTGKAWLDLGLTRPDWPRIVLGYEYQFREGDQSMLQWGPASDTNFVTRSIRPSAKRLDERTHILKLDATHEIAGIFLEDNFRAEFYDLQTTREHQGYFFDPADGAVHNESYDHFQAANSLRAEKQVRDGLFLSGGYLYTRLDGGGDFNQTFNPGSFNPSVSADRIALEQQSHTFNLNTRLGPWEGFTFAAGAQSDWVRKKGVAEGIFIDTTPAPHASDLDRSAVTEHLLLRYDRIPHTVLYADATFEQEWIDQFEEGLVGGTFDDPQDFVRDTDARGDLREYRGGFTLSPWQSVSLDASYRRRERQNDYEHRNDTNGFFDPFSFSGNGYPAFILSREVTSDEMEIKLVLRPARWLKTTLKYQLSAADYETITATNLLLVFDPNISDFTNVFYPGGEILAGNQDAHVYSVNATLTPWRQLYLSTTFSYSDSRIVSGVNNGLSVVPFRGDVYSVLSSGNLALSARTDLHATYLYSRADYGQDNAADGLPLGIEFERHGLTAGIRRRLSKNVTTDVRYGFFQYREPTAGGANDYTAHAVFASLSLNIP